jgi:tol-pal system protein YbgF
MRRMKWVPVLLLLGWSLAGCYGAKVLRQPVTVEESARDLEAVRQQQAAVEARLAELEKRSSEQAELLRGLRAETSTRSGELESRLATIDSRLRDALSQREGYGRPSPSFWNATPGATRTPDGDGGVAPAPATGAADSGGASVSPGKVEGNSGVRPGDGVIADSVAAQGAPPSEADTKRLYDQAYKDLTRGNYSLALIGFRDFLQRSPASDLADNAQYWIGECFYAQRDYSPAVTEFLKVEEAYPRGDKVPAALLKIGFSFLQLEDRASARRYLNQVVEQYPNSEEAVSARNKLHSAF